MHRLQTGHPIDPFVEAPRLGSRLTNRHLETASKDKRTTSNRNVLEARWRPDFARLIKRSMNLFGAFTPHTIPLKLWVGLVGGAGCCRCLLPFDDRTYRREVFHQVAHHTRHDKRGSKHKTSPPPQKRSGRGSVFVRLVPFDSSGQAFKTVVASVCLSIYVQAGGLHPSCQGSAYCCPRFK